MYGPAFLMATLSLVPAGQPKPEAPPPAVKKTFDDYLKAVTAKDVDAMAALAGVPWLDRDRKVVRERDGPAQGS